MRGAKSRRREHGAVRQQQAGAVEARRLRSKTTSVFLLVVLLLLSACGTAQPPDNRTVLNDSRYTPKTPELEACPGSTSGPGSSQLPEFTLPCLGPGPAVDMAAGRDKPTLINFWASWCPQCRRELPRLQAAHAAAGDRVLFLGVNTTDERVSALDLLATTGVTFPQVSDADGRFRAASNAPGVPVTLILDSSGTVVFRGIGELNSQELQQALTKVGVEIPLQKGPR